MISALLLAAQLHFGPTWGPWIEFPAYRSVEVSATKSTAAEVRLVRTRWNYRQQKHVPPITAKQQAWLKKWGHCLVDWRWDLETNGWVRKHKGRSRSLTSGIK